MATEDKKDLELSGESAEPELKSEHVTGSGEEQEPRGVKKFIKSGEVRDLIMER